VLVEASMRQGERWVVATAGAIRLFSLAESFPWPFTRWRQSKNDSAPSGAYAPIRGESARSFFWWCSPRGNRLLGCRRY
jgi:hypothetical protein